MYQRSTNFELLARNFPREFEDNFHLKNTTSEHPLIPQNCVGIDEKLFLNCFLVPSPKMTPKARQMMKTFVFIKFYSAEFYQ